MNHTDPRLEICALPGQLIALNEYIAEAASPSVAGHCTDAIAEFCFALAMFPERGMRRDDIRSGVRVTNYRRRAVMAFAVDTDSEELSILGVFYGGHDYETALGGLADDETP